MPSEKTATQRPRRRLAPEARREEIINAARELFAQRPMAQITTADIAAAAGVSRGLVHAYFGGIREVFFAVVAHSGAQLADVRVLKAPTPIDERLAANIPAALDVIAANRETWFAVMGHAHSSGDPQVDALRHAATEHFIARTLEVNSDLIADTPATRAALAALNALADESARQWLAGNIGRRQAEAYLIAAWKAILLEAIPALEAQREDG